MAFLFGRQNKGSSSAAPASTSTAPSSKGAAAALNEEVILHENKLKFASYVIDIARTQRLEITDRVEYIANHERNGFRYFIFSQVITAGAIYTYGFMYGTKHLFKKKHSLLRPLPLSAMMGLLMYHIIFTLRGIGMRSKINALIGDYEYQLKGARAHHVEEGMEQLAWLQFVSEKVRFSKEGDLDVEKMREIAMGDLRRTF